MSKKQVLAIIAGGLGNQIQMTAPLRTLRERLGMDVSVFSTGLPGDWNPHAEFDPVLPYKVYNGSTLPRDMQLYRNAQTFDGVIGLTFGAKGVETWARRRGWEVLGNPARQKVTLDKSEVDIAMNACRDLGIADEDLIWKGELRHNEGFAERFDVVLANGYHRGHDGNSRWELKGFPGFQSLAQEIHARWPGLSICSIGRTKNEYVQGTTDRTGLPLLDSLALLKRARFVVVTDSMSFHAAACFDTRIYALFTATSVVKNACPRFHANARIVGRDDLECRPDCQAKGRMFSCRTRHCQEIGINHIANIIAEDEGTAWSA